MNVKLGALIGSIASVVFAGSTSAATCDSLKSMTIPNVTISAAEVVTPPTPSGRRCRRASASAP